MDENLDHTLISDSEFENMLHRSSEEKEKLIKLQFDEIDGLKSQLDKVLCERDALLCEVNKLKFELEMSELKRLRDNRPKPCQQFARMESKNNNDSTTSSSPQRSDRPYCGPGPPIDRSNEQFLPGNCSTLQRLRQRSISGHGHSKRPPARTGEDVLKRTRMQTGYELSQDLLDKRVEMLERKYGGPERARTAALTIQRAFRRYAMLKKFAAITQSAKAEKRLSRRFLTMDLPMEFSTPTNVNMGPWAYNVVHSDPCDNSYDQIMNNALRDIDEEGEKSRPTRSHSLKEKRPCPHATDPLVAPVPSVVLSHIRSRSSGSSVVMDTSNDSLPDQSTTSSSSHDESQYYKHVSSPCPLSYVPNDSWAGAPCDTNSYYQISKDSLSGDSGVVLTPHETSRLGHKDLRKPPPQVPKRTTSIPDAKQWVQSRPQGGAIPNDVRYEHVSRHGLYRETGSLSSVQSSGSESSLSHPGDAEFGPPPLLLNGKPPDHPWKRKQGLGPEDRRYCEAAADGYPDSRQRSLAGPYCYHTPYHPVLYKVSETARKRQYRVGLNLFNKKPEKGIAYLIRRGFLEHSPQAVARFLVTRKGLSKQMIGEYLGNLQNQFNMAVLDCFSSEIDLWGMEVDVALRKYQAYFRMPGEAQKIERLVEAFSQRYNVCNSEVSAKWRCPDTTFILAFAIIMLNTDLHTPNIKPEKKMKVDDFIKNLRGIDDNQDLDRDMLVGVYERVKNNEFKPGSDHVSQVLKVQQTIVGKKPNLALPHRRLVCYCRLYEIPDVNKKERPGVHQREVFLFNDLLVVTKIFNKKKNSVTYTFRQSYPLVGLSVTVFSAQHYSYGIRLAQRVDNKVLVTFNARNEHDRCKFVEDLRESICEMDEMENLRIEQELEKQKTVRPRGAENRDSGVADIEVPADREEVHDGRPGGELLSLKRSTLSNSLLDMHEIGDAPQRRGSIGSLDSGMSVSFQSSNSTASRDSSPQIGVNPPARTPVKPSLPHQAPFLAGCGRKDQLVDCGDIRRTDV